MAADGHVVVASFASRCKTASFDWRMNYGTAAAVVFFDAFLRLGRVSDEDINLLSRLQVKLALMRYQQRHQQANKRIKFAVSRVVAVFVVVAPVVARRRMAIIDNNLAGACFSDLVAVQVRTSQNNVKFTKVELAHCFNC